MACAGKGTTVKIQLPVAPTPSWFIDSVNLIGRTVVVIIDDDPTIHSLGDSWRHLIQVEEVTNHDENFNYPICIGGENACPPEDCGGRPGIEDFKSKIADKKDPEHKEMLRWVGGYYNPKSFDANPHQSRHAMGR